MHTCIICIKLHSTIDYFLVFTTHEWKYEIWEQINFIIFKQLSQKMLQLTELLSENIIYIYINKSLANGFFPNI